MNKAPIKIFQVDAFTSEPFSGNPAAVCLLNAKKADDWMQSVAAEMNLSETAFVLPLNHQGEFELRWFTPTIEVDLCGHATLATAHILWQQGIIDKNHNPQFHTRSGVLTATREANKITLDFPASRTKPADEPMGLLQALGINLGEIYFDGVDYLIHLEHATDIRQLQPDFVKLSKIKARGFMVTATSTDSNYDFISRFFAPAAGINEDPVTGSAHCTLATFWYERLGKTKMLACQASNRGGVIGMEIKADRVLLSGDAITIFTGELYV